MDREEAQAVLAAKMADYRQRSYKELQGLVTELDIVEAKGPSGVLYQLEFQALWDDKMSGNLRILGSIDDGGLRAFFPLTQDFILAPDGSFVGE